MTVYRLFRQQWVPRPIEEVFAFFDRPENLSLITPPSLRFRLLTPSPIPMHQGAIIDYTIRLMGIPLRWTTYIALYEPPHRFVDIQIRGPYSFWHHTHRFDSVSGGTRITDEVLYVLPYGPLGRLAHALWVRRYLDHIFDYRRQYIARHFGPQELEHSSPRSLP